jgi:predicted nucleotidyltransferase
MTSPIITLDERKRARVQEIRAGFARLREALSQYAQEKGGRFYIYGSAARGTFHFESDIDILTDFPEAETSAALTFVEETASELRLKADVQPKAWCASAFLDRVLPSAKILS